MGQKQEFWQTVHWGSVCLPFPGLTSASRMPAARFVLTKALLRLAYERASERLRETNVALDMISSADSTIRSLEDIHASVPIPRSRWRRFFAFSGPAFLISVGYMGPCNWSTDLQAL